MTAAVASSSNSSRPPLTSYQKQAEEAVQAYSPERPYATQRSPLNKFDGARVHSENPNPNLKVYRGMINVSYLIRGVESTVHGQVVVRDVERLREKKPFVFNSVTNQRVQQYHTWRQIDSDRQAQKVYHRFPELKQAREDYHGLHEPIKAQNARMQANEVVKFSEVVNSL